MFKTMLIAPAEIGEMDIFRQNQKQYRRKVK
jgi:hypothetical protein